VARAFAASGDRVGLHYGSRGDAAAQVCASLPGDGHVIAGADLADAEAVRRMVDEVAGALGGIDVLVNNAGVFEPHAATETTYEEWHQAWTHTLGVNLVGAAGERRGARRQRGVVPAHVTRGESGVH
jgi:NAD(P)-dependent dehydrogenase (short-subunit alcohol dehydrogenase family)